VQNKGDKMKKVAVICGIVMALIPNVVSAADNVASAEKTVDVCVYGGTASGVIAAVAAAQEGRRVLLVEPSRHLGGMTGGGIGTIDYGARSTVGGLTDAFFKLHHKPDVQKPDQTKLRQGLSDLLRQHQVALITEHRLATVERQGLRITAITIEHAPPDRYGTPAATALPDPPQRITARVFIDAGYEGDLMAMAKVPYASGREAKAAYGESFAGRQAPAHVFPIDPWRIPGDPASGLLPLLIPDDGLPLGAADDGVPASQFRLQLSMDPADRAPFPDFGGYDPTRYELLGRWFAVRQVKGMYQHCPFYLHGKTYCEANDNRDEPVSLALIGGIRDYIDGDWPTRARVWQEHERYTVGLFRFLATDARVPESLRTKMASFGLRRSAFPDSDGWPHQLYIRQGRRMLGAYVVTQKDMMGEVEVPPDSIGLGSYKVDIYHCRRYATNNGIAVEGKVFTALGRNGRSATQDNNASQPFAIPFRALTPKAEACDNLLVPVCLSCSHVANSSLRMEPTYMLLGEAAGRAAAQAVAEDRAVQAIDVGKLQERLRAAGQVLTMP
jgi:FAD dependent oxidoreductase